MTEETQHCIRVGLNTICIASHLSFLSESNLHIREITEVLQLRIVEAQIRPPIVVKYVGTFGVGLR